MAKLIEVNGKQIIISGGESKVLTALKALSTKGKVDLHSKVVERHLIPDGRHSLSVSRLMRSLKQKGVIDYPNPRTNDHHYLINIVGHVSQQQTFF